MGRSVKEGAGNMKGLEISERFYEEYGRRMISEQFPEYESVIAAGIAGEGSDCFGYDDAVSRDHDFEAGFCLWIPKRLERELEFKLSRAYSKLPKEYMGVRRAEHSLWGQGRRGVILTEEFYSRFTGSGGVPESLEAWLQAPEYGLACAVNGKIFRDDCGEFSGIRRILEAGYPEDVRLKKIASRAALMAQSGQYNYMRCVKHGESGAAFMAVHEFVQNGLSMIFLLNRRYMPYYKWAFRAARELPILSELSGELEALLTVRENPKENSPAGGRLRKPECEKAERIEKISRAVIRELKEQRLTDGSWDYLEPHAYEVMERIRDSGLRNMHVMAE